MTGENLNRDQFNEMISPREQSRMEGQALGEHLWRGVEAIFGNIKVQNQSRAYDDLRGRFPNHEVHVDHDNDPYVTHEHGNWEARYYGGPHADLIHKRHGPQDLINYGEDHKHVDSDVLKADLHDFVTNHAPDYEAALRRDRGTRGY